MLKKFIVPLILIIISLIIPFIGISMTRVDNQGIVHEQLYFATIALFLFIVGILWAFAITIKSIFK